MRINVSVPRDLKEEMDRFPEINWSKVAREGFRQHLDEGVPYQEAIVAVTMPQQLKDEMNSFGEVNWSEIARNTFRKHVGKLKYDKSKNKDSKGD